MMAFTPKRLLGNKGEDIACQFLSKKGFEVIERNHLRPWGEIDIICKKGKELRFIEVKTVSRDTSDRLGSRATRPNMTAEDHLHPAKLKKLARTVDVYMADRPSMIDYQIDLVTVEMDVTTRTARCKLYEQIM